MSDWLRSCMSKVESIWFPSGNTATCRSKAGISSEYRCQTGCEIASLKLSPFGFLVARVSWIFFYTFFLSNMSRRANFLLTLRSLLNEQLA